MNGLLQIGTRVRLADRRRIGVGTIIELVEPKPGWHRALVRWGDGEQFVDIEKLEAVPSMKYLIAKSSIGAGLADIKERGIDAHLVDLEAEMKPKRRRKR